MEKSSLTARRVSEKKSIIIQKKMGQLLGKLKRHKTREIPNRYESMDDLTAALREAGLEKCNLLVAIDFTKSNTWQGEKTFGGKCLHDIGKGGTTYEIAEGAPGGDLKQDQGEMIDNPYQRVLKTAARPLNEFDEDKRIPTCIFGHARQHWEPYVREIFDSHSDVPNFEKGCHGLEGVLAAYEHAVKTYNFSGGTLFSPVLRWAQEKVVQSKNEYHILIILGDGNLDEKDMEDTQNILADSAKQYPLSIVFVGVGDGSDPKNEKDKWKRMRILDDCPKGDCDIWQSVYLANMQSQLDKSQHPDVELATMMLMEIPYQYKYFQSRGLVG